MLGKRAWLKMIVQNRGTIYKLMKEGLGGGRGSLSRSAEHVTSYAETIAPEAEA
jgi:hypothetical protein